MDSSKNLEEFNQLVPKVFTVETILGCDLKCPECAIGADIITRKKGCMSFEQFKIIADKIQPFCKYLYLHIWGEPLLNKDIFRMIEYASTFTKTNISTNGNCLTEEKAEKLIKAGVTDIIVSIDGVSQDVYEQYRKGGLVTKALWSLAKLQDLNLNYGNKVAIYPQFLVFKHNQHEMELFRKFCHSICLEPVYKAPYIRSSSRCQNSDKPEYVRPSYSDIASLRQIMADNCKNPKEVFTILLDGTCVMCCDDHNGITNYGNIYEQNVLDIWNSPRYRQDRLGIITANAPKYCIENCLNWTLCVPVMSGVAGDATQTNGDYCARTITSADFNGLSKNNENQLLEKKEYGRRRIPRYEVSDYQEWLRHARSSFQKGNFNKAFDIYEQLSIAYPNQAVEILAEAYDCYQMLPNKDRYRLYQSRMFNFDIGPDDKVLDIGSGHIPFPLATHLADIALDDDNYGRAGAPFKYIEGKPVFECNIEQLPFGDKEFDFVYCSHVLEHVANPEKACNELIRIAKRGYIETPTRGKDIWLNTAKISNHRWAVENIHNKLVFTEYTTEETNGLRNDILLNMHVAPQTVREKAFSALIYLRADLINTMFLWENEFEYEVRRICQEQDAKSEEVKIIKSNTGNKILGNKGKADLSKGAICNQKKERFLQVHTFYENYLKGFYDRNKILGNAKFEEQIAALIKDGFSGIHMFAPYMGDLGYESRLIIANNAFSQSKWLIENNIPLNSLQDRKNEILRKQIENIKPNILYLSDPIPFDSKFIRTLPQKPDLIIGWRAADIPDGTDWSEFDLMLSGLSGVREMAEKLGAKATECFIPGFPEIILKYLGNVNPIFDVVFSGSWTTGQHAKRNFYLSEVVKASGVKGNTFSCGLYLNSTTCPLRKVIENHNLGARFGIEMYKALRSGRIVLDARGEIRARGKGANNRNAVVDMARNETMNMRIFEATGSGAFLLTEYYDNLSEYFEIGKEIEVFRDEKELIEKIRYYLAHPKERQEIAKRGQERCLRDYSMEKRSREFDRIIQKHLLLKSQRDKPSTSVLSTSQLGKISNPNVDNQIIEVKELMRKALDAMNVNSIEVAFSYLNRAKSLKQPMKGLDFLRAVYFVKVNQLRAAREALKEELRYFPNNKGANDFLARINKECPQGSSINIRDIEFLELFKAIQPYTMVTEKRLYSLFSLARRVCVDNIPGNIVECGVAAGGATALMAYVIKKYSKEPRTLYAFDSFEGMPAPTEFDKAEGVFADATGWGTGTCAAPESSVREICAKLEASDIVKTVKGYFQDTLPKMRSTIGTIALLHMDGDWYESTKVILQNLYEDVVHNGLIQVDDYGHWEGCKKAVDEYQEQRSIKFRINNIDSSGIWFSKPSSLPVSPRVIEYRHNDRTVPKVY